MKERLWASSRAFWGRWQQNAINYEHRHNAESAVNCMLAQCESQGEGKAVITSEANWCQGLLVATDPKYWWTVK